MAILIDFVGTRYDAAELLASEPDRIFPWQVGGDGAMVHGNGVFPRSEDVLDWEKAEALKRLIAAGLADPPRPYLVYLARFLAWYYQGIKCRGMIADAFACGCVAWVKSDHPPSANTLTTFHSAVLKVWPEVESARPVVTLCRQWLTQQEDVPDSAPKAAIGPDERQLAIWLMHAGDGGDFLSMRRRMVARLACLPGMGYARMVNLTWGDIQRVNSMRPVYEVKIGLDKQLFHSGTPAAYDVHLYCEKVKNAHREVWGTEPGKAFPLLIRVKDGEPVIAWNGKMPAPLHATTVRGILRRMNERGA